MASYSQLQDIDSLLPLLQQLAKLKHLNLSGNDLKALPLNLGVLSSIETIELNDNPWEDLVGVVASLQTLPVLRNLSLNLSTNDEADLVLTSLPRLEYLNGQGRSAG